MANKKKVGGLLSPADLKRRYPDSGLASVICLPGDKSLRLPCDVISINYHTGGGIKYGSIVENFGEESTGKTLLAFNYGKVAQSLGGVMLFDDAECTFDPEWAQAHGLNLEMIQLLPMENRIEIVSDWIADMCIYWRSKLINNEPIFLVVDSIAVLEGSDAMETAETDTKAEMGRRSFKMGQLLRKRMKIFAKYGICVYLINQIRKKVGASKFEDPDTTPLAQCMKYYASQRMGLYRGKRIKKGGKDKGTWVGNMVYVRTKKNKSSIPRDNVQARVYFREDNGKFGYDKYFGFAELLEAKGILKRKSGKFYYKDKFLAEGDEAIYEYIATNPEFRSLMIKKLEVNTPSKTRKKLEEIGKNLYPVKAIKKEKDESTDKE